MPKYEEDAVFARAWEDVYPVFENRELVGYRRFFVEVMLDVKSGNNYVELNDEFYPKPR